MAPEQFEGRADARSDIYSFGCTLYELATLRPAFDDLSKVRLIDLIQQCEPLSPRRVEPALPRDLETIVLKAMAKEASRRYQSAADMAEDLRRFLADRPIQARRASWLEHGWRWARRNRAVAGLVALIALLLVVVSVGSSIAALFFNDQKNQAENNATRALRAEIAAREAESDARQKLWRSKLEEARARSLSRRPGQRVETLATLREALSIARQTGLSNQDRLAFRNVAIGCLTLPDVVEDRIWEGLPDRANWSLCWDFDATLESYARSDLKGNVTVRRVADDRPIASIPGDGQRNQIRLSQDARHVVVFSYTPAPAALKVWRLGGNSSVELVHQETAAAFCVANFRADGRELVFLAAGNRPAILDLETRTVRYLSEIGEGEHWVSISPNGRKLALPQTSNRQRPLLVMDSNTGDVLARLGQGTTFSDWSPDGKLLAYSAWDQKIHLVNTTDWLEVAVLEGHDTLGINMVFDASGERLYSNDWHSMLRIWDVRSATQLMVIPASGNHIAVGKEPGHIVVANPSDDGYLRILRFEPGIELRRSTMQGPGGVQRWGERPGVLSARDDLLAWSFRSTAGESQGIGILNASTGERLGVLHQSGAEPVGFDSHGNLVTAGTKGLLRWTRTEKVETDTLVFGPAESLHSGQRFSLGTMSADGSVLATPLLQQGFAVLHRDGRTFGVRPPGRTTKVIWAIVSSDGRWVVNSDLPDDKKGVRVWNAQTGQLVKELPSGGFNEAGFSPDGLWLWSNGGEGRIWRVGTWEPGPVIGGHWMAISPDSRIVASGEGVDLVRLVDRQTGGELARLCLDQNERLYPRLFTADGALFYAWGQQSEALYRWDLRLLRERLTELGLDWELPPLPALAPRPPRPRSVVFDVGQAKP